MLHLTIRTHHDPRIQGRTGGLQTSEGTLELVIQRIVAAILNAKTDGLLDTDGAIEVVIQNARIKPAGIPGRS